MVGGVVTEVHFIIQDDLEGQWRDFSYYRTEEAATAAFPDAIQITREWAQTWRKALPNFRLIRRVVTTTEEVVEL
jgi:hypothetical protein